LAVTACKICNSLPLHVMSDPVSLYCIVFEQIDRN